MQSFQNLPFLGVGLSYRSHLLDLVMRHQEQIGFLEVIADHYLDATEEKMQELRLLKRHFTIIPHAIELNLGSPDEVDQAYVKKLDRLIDHLEAPYWSEHISYCRVGGIEIGHLTPLAFTHEAIDRIRRNVDEVRKTIKAPLILENISYTMNMPGAEMEEADFLAELLTTVDCGLLLDVTNLYYNACNHRYDTHSYLEKIPADRIVQLHFTGGYFHEANKIFIDDHSKPTPPEVWHLMEQVLRKHKAKGAVLERDDHAPDHQEVLDDVVKAKDLLSRYV